MRSQKNESLRGGFRAWFLGISCARLACLACAVLPLLLPAASAFAAETSANTYLPLFKQRLEKAFELPQNPPKLTDKGRFTNAVLYPAHLAYLTAKASGEKRYTDLALELYDLALSRDIDMSDKADFHYAWEWGNLTYLLRRDGLLTGEREKKAQALAAQALKAFSKERTWMWVEGDFWDTNIGMGLTVAASGAAAAFPNDPNAKAAKQKLAKLLDQIAARGDLTENSSCYGPLILVFYVELLKQENRLGDLAKNPNFHRLFLRWRDFASPGRLFPEIADDYFAYDGFRLDLVSLLEQGARIFKDPSLAVEARRLMQRTPGVMAIVDSTLVRCVGLLDLPPYSYDEKGAGAVLSVVHKRALAPGPAGELFSMLALRTGSKPGDAMLMMDLYATGSHGHPARRAAIAYYEAGGVPLFHNLGRHGTNSGINGNVFWTEKDFDAFPGIARPGVWNTQVFALENLSKTGPDQYTLGEKMWLRTFPKDNVKYVIFDNLRLEGPAGTKVIDDFSDRSLWVDFRNSPFQPDHPEWIETVDEASEGKSAQKLWWGPVTRQAQMPLCRGLGKDRTTSISFSSREYDCVKLDYKYEGALPYVILRGWVTPNVALGYAPLPCEVADARVKQLDSSAWGRVDFTNYMGAGSQLSRRMLLTREGALVVVDRYAPGKRDLQKTVGQLWQLYSLAEKGSDWFAGASDGLFPQADGAERPERRMLVKYFAAPGTVCAANEVTPGAMTAYKIEDGKKVPYKTFWTTSAKTKMSGAGNPFTAVQVIYPLLKNAAATETAGKIQFVKVGDGSAEIILPGEKGGNLRIVLDGDGAEVSR